MNRFFQSLGRTCALAACVLTTTDEELRLVRPLTLARGWTLEVPARRTTTYDILEVYGPPRHEDTKQKLP